MMPMNDILAQPAEAAQRHHSPESVVSAAAAACFAAAEAALSSAGVHFTVVARCPAPECARCAGRSFADAA